MGAFGVQDIKLENGGVVMAEEPAAPKEAESAVLIKVQTKNLEQEFKIQKVRLQALLLQQKVLQQKAPKQKMLLKVSLKVLSRLPPLRPPSCCRASVGTLCNTLAHAPPLVNCLLAE